MHHDAPQILNLQIDPARRLLQINWNVNLKRSASGIPTQTPEFVAEQGRSVRLFDLRDDNELLGFLGHIPGIVRVRPADLPLLAQAYPSDTAIILVSNHGNRAGKAALYLEMLGMKFVAAMYGGMQEWKRMGYLVSRHTRVLKRLFSLDTPDIGLEDYVKLQNTTKAGQHLDGRDVETHLGDPANIRWIRLAALLSHGKRSCVDGRDEKGVIGVPGGDAGDFLLALAAVERVTQQHIDLNHLPQLLQNYVDSFGRFYMHSDIDCANAMIRSIRQDPRLATQVPQLQRAEDWRAYFASPPPELREAILEHLLQPPHIGCGHIRLMMLHGEEYGIRRELVEHFLRAFHHLRWSGVTDLEFIILGGRHDEGAIMNVHVTDDVEPFSKLPLVSPACGNSQMFVNHPQVSAYARKQSGLFMLRQPKLLPLQEQHHDAFLQEIQDLAQSQLFTTLHHLAKGLPLYNVCFHAERMFTLEYNGCIE
ncbi:rhodanese-like domain-containing protein [Myxococcota bacterium]|nr:rhodanese-like domain-containing protein [Myxococcota bacterium]